LSQGTVVVGIALAVPEISHMSVASILQI